MKKIALTVIVMMVLSFVAFSQNATPCSKLVPKDSVNSEKFWKSKNSHDLFLIMKSCPFEIANIAYQNFMPICNDMGCYCDASNMYETSFGASLVATLIDSIERNPKSANLKDYMKILVDYAWYSIGDSVDSIMNIGTANMIIEKMINWAESSKIAFSEIKTQLIVIFGSSISSIQQKRTIMNIVINHSSLNSFLKGIDYIPDGMEEEIYNKIKIEEQSSFLIIRLFYLFPNKVEETFKTMYEKKIEFSVIEKKSLLCMDNTTEFNEIDKHAAEKFLQYQLGLFKELEDNDQLSLNFLISIAREDWGGHCYYPDAIKKEAKKTLKVYADVLSSLKK